VSEDEGSSKTEAPTEKKLTDAINRGNTPFSREVVSLGSLAGLIGSFVLLLPKSTVLLTGLLQTQFATLDQRALQSPGDATTFLGNLSEQVLTIISPILAVLALGGVAGSVLQNVPSIALDRVGMKWNRLSPGKNISKIIGKEAMIEFVKTAVKFLCLVVLIFHVLRTKVDTVLNIGLTESSLIPKIILQTTLDILVPAAVFVLILAIIDVVWTRLKWWNDLKMTRHEQKEEHKSAEGDPVFKQRRRFMAQKRMKSRMMADVPKATLVVVNPSHYAIAMRYVAQEGGAPLVLAKGLDLVALKIRELSEKHEVPIVEDRPLARSLYASCEVGEMIPPEYYKAVAEVILFIDRKRQHAENQSKKQSRL
jgi:flagellar biosynthesis protein FlhB